MSSVSAQYTLGSSNNLDTLSAIFLNWDTYQGDSITKTHIQMYDHADADTPKHTKPPRAPHASTLSGSIKLCLLDIASYIHTFIHPMVMLRTSPNIIYTQHRIRWEQDERKHCVYKLNANSELNYPTVYLPCF